MVTSENNGANLEDIATDTSTLDEITKCIRTAKNWPLQQQLEYFEATKRLFGNQLPKEMIPINPDYVDNELLNSARFRSLCQIPSEDRGCYRYAVMAGIALYCRKRAYK